MQRKILLFFLGIFSWCFITPALETSSAISDEDDEEIFSDILNEDLIREPVVFKKPHPLMVFFEDRCLRIILKLFELKKYCQEVAQKWRSAFAKAHDDYQNR
jgi:hypothetical protein